MFRVNLSLFDSEKACKKKVKFIIRGSEAIVVSPAGVRPTELAKSVGCLLSDLVQLTSAEVDLVHRQLLQANTQVDTAIKVNQQLLSNKPEAKAVKTETKVVKPVVRAVKPEPKAASTMTEKASVYKLNFKCPSLKLQSPEEVEESIDALQLAKSLGICDDQNLIFQTITESGRYDIFKSLSDTQKKDLDEFCSYLRLCYGNDESGLKQLRRFDEIKQQEGENCIVFFNRVINTFYSSRNKSKPAAIPKDDQMVIRKTFVEQLNNQQVKAAVVSNLSTINFEDLGTQAKRYSEAFDILKVNKQLSVMAIHSDNAPTDTRNRSSSRGRDRDRSHSRGRSYGHRSWSRDRRSSSRGYESRQGRDRDSSRGRYRGNRWDRSSSRGRYRSMSGDRYQRRDDRYRSRSGDRYGSGSSHSPGRESRQVSWADRQVTCYRCGLTGHIRRECQASAKSVMQFRRRLDRSHERRNDRR